jgi:hypothetical protein
MDYTTMPLLTQLATIKADVGAVGTLESMAEMWGKAATELSRSSGDFQAATNKIEPNWTDDSGRQFVGDARESNKTIDTWAQNIANSQAQAKIGQVAGQIPGTAQAVQQVVDQYNKMLPFAALLGMTPEELELMFRPMAGAEMNKLAGTYQEAIAAVGKARGGSWQGPQSDHAGAQSVDDVSARGIELPVGPQGAGSGAAAATDDAGTLAGAAPGELATGADGEVPGLGTDDPSLSGGLGGAPIAPPTLPPITPPPVAPGLPVGGMPPMMPGGFGGGRGVSGGIRVPGVRLGGGGPVGAQPINSPAAPTPASAPTVAQLTAATPTTGSATAGVPPMMPPMGAGASVAGGGIPGPGRARRKRRDDDDGEPPTPGMPAALSGKAGLPDAFRYSSVRRTETDAPGTVQLIDEDLWHEQQAPVRSYAR